MQQRITDLTRHAERHAERQSDDELFSAYQNGCVVLNGEAYYRTIYRRNISSWNLRDRHMEETIHELVEHLNAPGKEHSKIIVWARNNHLGDARTMQMSERGELSIGQLMRQWHNGSAPRLHHVHREGTRGIGVGRD
jgi:erythromycin esterase-like protein